MAISLILVEVSQRTETYTNRLHMAAPWAARVLARSTKVRAAITSIIQPICIFGAFYVANQEAGLVLARSVYVMVGVAIMEKVLALA